MLLIHFLLLAFVASASPVNVIIDLANYPNVGKERIVPVYKGKSPHLLVKDIPSGSPFDVFNLKEGDKVTWVNGQPIAEGSMSDFTLPFLMGGRVSFVVEHTGGESRSYTVEITKPVRRPPRKKQRKTSQKGAPQFNVVGIYRVGPPVKVKVSETLVEKGKHDSQFVLRYTFDLEKPIKKVSAFAVLQVKLPGEKKSQLSNYLLKTKCPEDVQPQVCTSRMYIHNKRGLQSLPKLFKFKVFAGKHSHESSWRPDERAKALLRSYIK